MTVSWYCNNLGISDTDVYTEVSGNFSFTDSDVSWLYIDWDDGEDNSLTKAAYQWKKLETDAANIYVKHTYTATGQFYPVVRTVNSTGFLSKYYYDNGKTSTDSIPSPTQEVTNITGLTVNDGDPLSVLKVEDKIVRSGIDNSIFEEGPKQVWIYVPPILASTSAALDKTCAIKVKYIEATLVTSGPGPAASGNFDLGYERIVKETEKEFDLRAGSGSINLLGQLNELSDISNKRALGLLDVRLTTPRIDTSINSVRNDFNQLKFFLIAQGNDDNWYPITYVSNGDPIKKAKDRQVTLDFSQTRAKASNTSISSYKFDDGKVFWTPVDQWQALSSTDFTNTTKTTSSLLSTGYTYYTRPVGLLGSSSIGGNSSAGFTNSGQHFFYGTGYTYDFVRDQFVMNEYNQFYDQYHLARINASSSGITNSNLDVFTGAYRITPSISTTTAGDFFLETNVNSSTQIETTDAYYNASGNIMNTDNWNGVFFLNDDAIARPMSEYFLFTNDVKTNKIFFNNTPYAKQFMSDLTIYTSGNQVAGLYYLKLGEKVQGDKFTQTAEWAPLQFKDTTMVSKEIRDSSSGKYITYEETMTKPGFLEFDMPSDWSSVSISGLCGGLFNNGTANPTGATDYSKNISAAWVSGTGGNYNDDGTFDLAHNDYLNAKAYVLTTTDLSAYTDEEIGSFNYTYQYSGGGAAISDGTVYWVVSSSVATDELFLLKGKTIVNLGAGGGTGFFGGVMRRNNIYEVFDGTPKAIVSTPTSALMPHQGDVPYPYTFVVSSAAFLSNLASDFVDIYPLKMVLSQPYASGGAGPPTLEGVSHFVSGASRTGMEMWNALPFNNSYSQTIIQKDNTAYDLSYMDITSNVSMNYAGTYYQAISKKGKVFIKRTGTPIQSITFGGNALGDEESFSFNEDYKSYGTLRLLRRIEAESVRVMWDEQQKDSTFVRFFGFVNNVAETHQVTGKRASRPYTFTLVVEEICLLDTNGNLMSDVEPLGGSPDDKRYQ